MSHGIDIGAIRTALIRAAYECRYHGKDFGRGGFWHGEPRCDSYKPPWRNAQAIAALDRISTTLASMTAHHTVAIVEAASAYIHAGRHTEESENSRDDLDEAVRRYDSAPAAGASRG
jgi:hypothetical protein